VAQTKINENDKPFLIECEAEGEPVPTYVFDFSFFLFITCGINITYLQIAFWTVCCYY